MELGAVAGELLLAEGARRAPVGRELGDELAVGPAVVGEDGEAAVDELERVGPGSDTWVHCGVGWLSASRKRCWSA